MENNQTAVLAVYQEFRETFFEEGSPAWFGGAWLEGDRLVVAVSGEGAPLDWMEQRLIEVRAAARPESELRALMETVTARMKETEAALQIEAVWIDPRKNCLRVALSGPLKEAKSWFREEISDSEAIRFIQDRFQPDADYRSGEIFGCITAANGAHFGAIGYPAVDAANRQGFVTAGHVVANCQPTIYAHVVPGAGGAYVPIGTVSQQENATLDAAFVALNPGFGVRRTCPVFPTSPMAPLAYAHDLPVGTVLEIYSRHNPNQIVQAVVSGQSAAVGGFQDLYILTLRPTSPAPVSGDSGAPVTTAGNHEVVGIHKGMFVYSRRLVAVKERNIRAAFNVAFDNNAPL